MHVVKCVGVVWRQDRLALVCAAFSTGLVPGPGGEVTEGMAALLVSVWCLPFKGNQCLGDEMALPDFGKQSDLVTT